MQKGPQQRAVEHAPVRSSFTNNAYLFRFPSISICDLFARRPAGLHAASVAQPPLHRYAASVHIDAASITGMLPVYHRYAASKAQ
eukprot:scaffold46165_cov20-Tisochrysis_lutea.AAC.1